MAGKDFVFKTLLLGDGAVGKTSIRERYMGKGFSGSYSKTVGADFASQRMKVEDNNITLQIFDLVTGCIRYFKEKFLQRWAICIINF